MPASGENACGRQCGSPPTSLRPARCGSLDPQHQRACLMRAVNSCTRLYTDRSSRMRRVILSFAWITVVWIAASELLPDHRQRRVGELARQVHRDLPRIRDRLRPPRADELVERDAEPLRDRLLDPRDRHLRRCFALRVDVAKDVLRELDGQRAVRERRERDDAGERLRARGCSPTRGRR